ncbi:MAG: diacylglycerol kinase family lipid kinase [Chthoniobacterales bacterium]|nr:diacylglycerol kinase family lipid kinase [Chthoniobacterales bacterium]
MIVILNRAAGTPGGEDEESNANITAAFAAHGAEIRIVQPDESTDLAALAQAAAGDAERVVVAGGGDGTVSAVAAALAGSGKTLGVLPLGTLNHFAKDLRIPLDLPAAVETIVRGRTAEIDLGEVNGRRFINNSSLGLYPGIVASREAQQDRLARGKWSAFFWSTLRAFRHFPFLNLRITVEGKQVVRRTAFLFVGNNEYQMAGFKLGGRSCINASKLGLYLTHRTGRFGLFRLAFRALIGRLEQAEDFESFCVEEATIETRRPSLLVAIDGEVTRMETPLHYRVCPAALRVLVPQSSD